MTKVYRIAFFWGLAEATFFFFIPDIYLTRVVLTHAQKAYAACGIAAFSACLGGLIMYYFGQSNGFAAEVFLAHIPGISHLLISHVSQNFQQAPVMTLLLGPLHGIPYKILAVLFGEYRLSLPLFILVSFIARLVRFLATTSITQLLAYFLKKRLTLITLYIIHALIWLSIYGLYFYQMSRNFG